MKMLDDIKIGKKLIGLVLMMVIVMIIIGGMGYYGVTTTNEKSSKMYHEELLPIDQLETIQSEVYQIRGNTPGYLAIPSDREKNRKQNDALIPFIDANLTSYKSHIHSDEELAIFNSGVKAWEGYKAALTDFYPIVDSGNTTAALIQLTTGDLVNNRKAFSASLDQLVSMRINDAKNFDDQNDQLSVFITILIMLVIIIGAIFSLFFGILISRSISLPLSKGVHMMQEMSLGHLGTRLHMTRKDEIGVLGAAMDTFSDDLQFVIVKGMNQIAAGDLSLSIPPRDDKDEIIPAFNQLIATINGIVGEIGTLITGAEEGRLQQRGDSARFTGTYQHIIIGINNMLEAITDPLNEALRVADLYARGQFSARFDEEVMVKGDLIALKEGLNTVGNELAIAIDDISEQVRSLSASSEEAAASVEEITAGSASIAQSSSVVSSNAENSVTAIEQVLSAMVDLSSSVTTVATKVDSVSRLTQDANTTSANGLSQAAQAENGINAINEAVQDVGTTITEIRSQMDEIKKIVVIISDIADQTNLLALNAAIEAARAGNAGMGFAVVANEVKTLAQESQKSAENIARIIGSLQKQSERAVTAMGKANNEVSRGSLAITDTIHFFQSIAKQVEEITKNMTEVASLSEEEAASVQVISSSVSEVKTMAIETAKEAVGSAAASEESSAALNQVSSVISNLSVITSRIHNSVSRLSG